MFGGGQPIIQEGPAPGISAGVEVGSQSTPRAPPSFLTPQTPSRRQTVANHRALINGARRVSDFTLQYSTESVRSRYSVVVSVMVRSLDSKKAFLRSYRVHFSE